MKKTTLFALLALVSGVALADVKIAVVDFDEVAAKSPQAEAINEKLKKEFSDRNEAMKKMEADIKAARDKLQKEGPTMTQQQQIDAQRNGEKMVQDYQFKGKAMEDDFKRRRTEEMRTLGSKIAATVNAIAVKEGYTVVLHKGTTAYFQPQLDITALVISQMGTPTAAVKPAGK